MTVTLRVCKLMMGSRAGFWFEASFNLVFRDARPRACIDEGDVSVIARADCVYVTCEIEVRDCLDDHWVFFRVRDVAITFVRDGEVPSLEVEFHDAVDGFQSAVRARSGYCLHSMAGCIRDTRGLRILGMCSSSLCLPRLGC